LDGVVSAYIVHFSYLGLFAVLILCGLGLPVPEDVALLTGGAAIASEGSNESTGCTEIGAPQARQVVQ